MTIKEIAKKYLTKTTLVVGLVILSFGGIYIAVNQHSKLTQARSELVMSNALNSVIEGEKHRLDSIIIVKSKAIKERENTISNQDKKILSQSKTITMLQDSLKHTLVDVNTVTADESYKYMNLRIPPVAPLKYPFDSLQVKRFHYTFLERDGLFDISSKQTILISDLNLTSSLKDSQIIDLKTLNATYISKDAICRKENDTKTAEITGLNKVVKQQKFLKNILLPPAAVGVVMVAIKILSK
jgi:hypothetical protein